MRITRLAILAVLCSGACTFTFFAQKAIVITEDVLPSLGKTIDLPNSIVFIIDSARPASWVSQHTFERSNPEFIRLHFQIQASTDNDWSLSLLDSTGATVDVLTAARSGPDGGVWSRQIPGKTAKWNFRVNAARQVVLRIDRYTYQYKEPPPAAVLGKTSNIVDLMKAYGPQSTYYEFSKPVVFISFISLLQKKETNCTGVLVANNLALTNYHCISTKEQLATAAVKVGVETGNLSKVREGTVARIAAKSEWLDYSLLVLAGFGDTAELAAPIGLNELAAGDKLILPQHPGGQPKMIDAAKCAVQSNSVIGLKEGSYTDIKHLCDSEGGSSGSPLLRRDNGMLVALHHMAVIDPKKNRYENYGVQICQILEDIKPQDEAAYSSITHGHDCKPQN
jgi:hypothetical protein